MISRHLSFLQVIKNPRSVEKETRSETPLMETATKKLKISLANMPNWSASLERWALPNRNIKMT